ncbi:MAG: O-antigen ligase family protein [Pirellulales bacterium]|nr:O-antigen ligase family protein [Pirellulales bacterium]
MEFLLFIVTIVALVWASVFFLRGNLLLGCLAVLLAGSCFGHPFWNATFGPIPLTIHRVLWVGLIGVCIVWRRLGRTDVKPLGPPEIAMYAFIAVVCLSALSHDWKTNNYNPLTALVLCYVMPAGIYWVIRQAQVSEGSQRIVFTALGGFGLYLALTGIAEVTGQYWVVFPRYIASPQHAEFFGRARGPLLNPAAGGFALSVCAFAGLMLWPYVGRKGRIALAAFSMACMVGVACSLTRSVWLGFGLGAMVLAGLALPKRLRLPLLGGSLLFAVVIAATQWDNIISFKRDKELSARATASSVELRPILARIAWNMFKDKPLFGCGYGQYMNEHGKYLSDHTTELPLEMGRPYVQHNVFLNLLAETGLTGMSLFILLLVLWSRDAWRLWRSPYAPLWARQQGLLFLTMMGPYISNATFHDVSLMPMANALLFFVAGLTAAVRGLVMSPEKAGKPAQPDRSFSWTGSIFHQPWWKTSS